MADKMILEVIHDGFNTHLVSLELNCLPFAKINSRVELIHSLNTIYVMRERLSASGYMKNFGHQTDYDKINKFFKGVLFLTDKQIEKNAERFY